MRRIAAFAGVLGIAAALVVPTAAHAADPLPPDLNPIYDLPSTWPGGTLTEEEAILRKHEIDMARDAANAKWYTQAVDLTTWKGLGKAGGVAVGGFLLGFDVGVNGVSTVALVQTVVDGEVPDWWCNTPDWYVGSTIIGGFGGLGSSCPTVPYLEPNSDAPVTWGDITAGGGFASYKGIVGTAPSTFYCYQFTAPSGLTVEAVQASSGNWVGVGPFSHSPCTALGGNRALATNVFTGPALRFRDVSTGATYTMSQSSANPGRQARCRYDFAGLPSKYSDWVTYTDADGFPADAFAAACDTVGSTLTGEEIIELESIGVESRQEGGSITEIADAEVPTEMDGYPGRKALTLIKTLDTGAEISCLTEGELCRGWWEATDEGTSTTSPYRCTYGGVAVDLLECAPYRYSFELGTTPGTITDPQTGEEIPWGSTDPNSMDPGVGPSPGENCMASWGSAPNPIEWVFWPVKCALVWAFVPRVEVVDAHASTVENKWRNSMPGQLATSIAGVSLAISELDAGDCGGIILAVPHVNVDGSLGTENRAFLPACPGDFFAPWAPIFYWFITAAIAFVGFFAIKRQLDRFVGLA